MTTEIPRFFMGTSTKNGFLGFPCDLYETDPDAHAFLIKSGPGTGKSTLLRSVASRFREQGETVEEILCSSDPDSMDGIHLPHRRVTVYDATAPHVLEPQSWGLKEEIVSLGEALDVAALAQNRDALADATAENAAEHARARRFLQGAFALFSDRYALFTHALKRAAVARIAARLAETELKATPQPCAFSGSRRRFLSAVTPKGLLTLANTPAALCPRIILLDDAGFAAATALLTALKEIADARALPTVVCPHPIAPEHIAHLLLPSIGVAFVSGEAGKNDFSPTRTLHLKRCYEETLLKANKHRAAFDKKAEHALVLTATEALAKAKSAHDLIEIPYKSAMNFKKLKTTKTALYQRILSFPVQN